MQSDARLMLALLLAHPLAAFGTIEFCGFMSDSRAVRFVLTDSDTGVRSTWLGVGELFQGYTIMEFNIKSEVLVVRRDPETLRLPLQTSKIREGQSAPSPSIVIVSIGGQSSISVRHDPIYSLHWK